ncbi:S-adenosyl-L-methionine-dependent methyltransferase [Dactylonectria estremocensis]|uniref:S-adenosyl-L-methionine-dependent methyltransferase n=1 Tax=Dactylonectria estremocensis TaxID=1079267 RepID=A0A9P9ERQ3_9HYPO|nr:S-adenosyl-L-methionine-dependent methyltransferase [Dactylonectria estremocensis]
MITAEKTQYDSFAPKYASVEELPCSKLEAQLVITALGDCTGLKVLDLGGGSGLHARRVVDAGGAVVDVVDISPEMMRAGQDIETQLGRQGRIRWFEADVTRPLAEQVKDGVLEPERYDLVMANWVFDHATSISELKSMWENVVASLKPGGRFIGVRAKSVRAEYMSYGKYGVTFTEVEEIPHGLKYKVGCVTEPPFSFEATSMESTYSLSDGIACELGLVDFRVIDPEETDIVKNDVKFWDDYVKDPNFVVVVARKG